MPFEILKISCLDTDTGGIPRYSTSNTVKLVQFIIGISKSVSDTKYLGIVRYRDKFACALHGYIHEGATVLNINHMTLDTLKSTGTGP